MADTINLKDSWQQGISDSAKRLRNSKERKAEAGRVRAKRYGEKQKERLLTLKKERLLTLKKERLLTLKKERLLTLKKELLKNHPKKITENQLKKIVPQKDEIIGENGKGSHVVKTFMVESRKRNRIYLKRKTTIEITTREENDKSMLWTQRSQVKQKKEQIGGCIVKNERVNKEEKKDM